MKMSMFQIILLAVFGASAVAGVLIFAFVVGGGTSTSTGPVVIWGTFDRNTMTEIISQLSDTDPNLSKVTYVQKDSDTYMADITDAFASGQGPDLFILRQDYALAQASRIEQIPFAVKTRTDFEQAFIDGSHIFIGANGILGVPILVDPLVLYWNKDMLSTGGYARPPQNWEELYDMATKMTKRDDTKKILKSAIAFGEFKNIHNAKDILAMLILQAGGAIVVRDADGVFSPVLASGVGSNAQAAVAALRFFTEFADPSKDYYSWSGSLPEAQDAFAAGDLALYIGHASEKRQIALKNPNLNFAVAPVPQRRASGSAIDAANVYAFARSRTSKNPAGAMTVAFSLAQQGPAKLISDALQVPSARRDILSQPTDGDMAIFNKQAIIARTWADPNPAKTNDIFRAMIETTTSGAALISEAVQRADRELASLLNI